MSNAIQMLWNARTALFTKLPASRFPAVSWFRLVQFLWNTKVSFGVNGSCQQEPPLGGVPAGGFVGTAGNKGAGGFVNSAVSIVSMVTYTSDLNPYLCSSMNSGANHLTGTRFCNSCSVSKYISHKYAFQWDAYCPLVSRMPAWRVGGGGVCQRGCLLGGRLTGVTGCLPRGGGVSATPLVDRQTPVKT